MTTWLGRKRSSQYRPQSHATPLRFPLKVATTFLAVLPSGPGIDCFAASPAEQFEKVEDTKRIEIPFAMNDNLVIVKVSVGPLKDINMILDTGTSPSAISRELASRLKLRGNTEVLVTLNGTVQAQSVVVPGIQVGPLHAESVRVVVQDLDFMEKSLGISLGGIVGLDILEAGCFTIDYKRRKIVFGPIDSSENTVPFARKAPFLTVKVKIEGQELRLLVDSGIGGVLVFRNRLKAREAQVHFDTSIASISGKTHFGWLRAEVSLGRNRLGVRNIAIADQDPGYGSDLDGLFGFGQMGFHKVSFDFENGMLGWE